MELIELPHLCIGSPSEVTPSCVSQVDMRDFLEAARRVKAGSQLIGERFVVDKVVVSRRADGLFIQMLGIEHAALDPGDLRADQRGAVLEIFGAVLRPNSDPFVMPGQSLQMLSALIG